MNCTRCHKEINEGEIVYVSHEYSDDLDFPFCSYECLGRYFCNAKATVSEELIDLYNKADDKEEALTEWIYG